MVVLLLNPRRGPKDSFTIIPNIGLGHLAKVLRDDGHEVKIIDANRDRITPEEFGRIAARLRPGWIGITTFSPYLASVRLYARAAKKAVDDTKIVLGGPHPTFEPEETLQRIPEADYLVRCEGEPAVGLLTRHLETGDPPLGSIPHLVWREGVGVRINEGGFIEDLDALGPPAWDLLEPHRFPLAPNGIFSRAATVAPIIATRGCPYPCTFCGASRSMGKKLRTRSAESIRDEMDLLHRRFGIGEVHFMDDNFTQNRDLVERLCGLLIEKGPHIPWACPNGVRLDRIDRDLAWLMERAGCYSMAVGIEFGSDRILAAIKKNLTVDQIESAIGAIKQKTKIRLTGFFILGHPEETEEEIEQTIDLSLRLSLDRANFFNFTPFAGSPLYDELKSSGALSHIDPETLYIHSVAYHPPHLSAARLIRLQQKAHLRFYLRPRILAGLLSEIKGWPQIKVVARRAKHLLTGH